MPCRHNVTVVDVDAEHVRNINARLDVRAIHGSASESSVLFQAGVLSADLCLAVTGDDEVNLVAGSIARAMGTRRSVARVYASIFRDMSTFDYQRHFRIDRLLSLEHLSAIELSRGIRSDGLIGIKNMGAGQLEANAVTVGERSPVVRKALKEIKLPSRVRVGSILRDGKMWIAGADDTVQAGDRVTLIGRREDIDDVRGTFQKKPEPKRDVVIVGGGETGYHLARMLEDGRYRVSLLDVSQERCELIAGHLHHATVIHADGTRRDALEEERVGKADVFVACTGDDENNIMAGVEAREMGTKTVMAIVSRPDYAGIVGKLGIDLAVSPRDVISRQVMSFLHTGPVISRTRLAGGDIDLIEIEVLEGAAATQQTLAELSLPGHCLIAAVIRHDSVYVAGAEDRLKPGDSIVVLVHEESVKPLLGLFHAPG